jgi:DNA-binding CsgD family transcriptional regulator
MVHPGITRRMLDRLSVITRDGNGGLLFGEKLTEREADILVEVAKGSTNKEIAHKLFIAESTVKSRLHSIFSKIDAHDRAQATAFAIREGTCAIAAPGRSPSSPRPKDFRSILPRGRVRPGSGRPGSRASSGSTKSSGWRGNSWPSDARL